MINLGTVFLAQTNPTYIWGISLLPFLAFVVWLLVKINHMYNKENRNNLPEIITKFIMGIFFIIFGMVGTLVYLTHIDMSIFFLFMFAIGCIVFFFDLRSILKKRDKSS